MKYLFLIALLFLSGCCGNCIKAILTEIPTEPVYPEYRVTFCLNKSCSKYLIFEDEVNEDTIFVDGDKAYKLDLER